MFFSGLALFLFAEQVIGVFTPDQEVIAIAAFCLRVEASIQVPQVIGWIYSGALRGMGNTKIGFYLNALACWVIRVPYMLIAIHLMNQPLTQAYLCVAVECRFRQTRAFYKL